MQIKYTAIAYLSVLLTLNSLLLSSVQTQASYVSFLDWCQAQEKLNSEAKHTIKAVLEELGSDDCTRASKRLNVITRLNLASRQISDQLNSTRFNEKPSIRSKSPRILN